MTLNPLLRSLHDDRDTGRCLSSEAADESLLIPLSLGDHELRRHCAARGCLDAYDNGLCCAKIGSNVPRRPIVLMVKATDIVYGTAFGVALYAK